MGELVVGAGEADLQAFGFAGPALASGFGDAVVISLRCLSFALLWPKATGLPVQAAK